MIDDDKRLAAEAAVAEIEAGMLIGLGTGSTAAFAIAALGARVRDGLPITAVATSIATEALARSHGIAVIDFADVAKVDLTIDGVDEIDDRFFTIKGAGGAMLREKIVAMASRRMIVIADGSKRVARIGGAKLPIEILPFAFCFVAERLGELGGRSALRMAGTDPYRTDNGNAVIDCRFDVIDPRWLGEQLDGIPGILGHGLFLDEIDAAYIARDGIVTRLERGDPSP